MPLEKLKPSVEVLTEQLKIAHEEVAQTVLEEEIARAEARSAAMEQDQAEQAKIAAEANAKAEAAAEELVEAYKITEAEERKRLAVLSEEQLQAALAAEAPANAEWAKRAAETEKLYAEAAAAVAAQKTELDDG